MDRERQAWETNTPGPFLTIGQVGVHTLGGDRYLVTSPDGEQQVEGFEEARARAHELACLEGVHRRP
jgi:hypothetical protein